MKASEVLRSGLWKARFWIARRLVRVANWLIAEPQVRNNPARKIVYSSHDAIPVDENPQLVYIALAEQEEAEE